MDSACAMLCVLLPEVNWLLILTWVPTSLIRKRESAVSTYLERYINFVGESVLIRLLSRILSLGGKLYKMLYQGGLQGRPSRNIWDFKSFIILSDGGGKITPRTVLFLDALLFFFLGKLPLHQTRQNPACIIVVIVATRSWTVTCPISQLHPYHLKILKSDRNIGHLQYLIMRTLPVNVN